MKKVLTLLTALCLIGTPVFAATVMDTSWSGSGNFESHFYASDDTETHFWTGGSTIDGQFHATDSDDNPYNYNVDTVYGNVEAYVSNGGFMEYEINRLDSKSSYGVAGQHSYSYMETSDSGEMAFSFRTNYASMRNCQYGKPSTTNGNFEAAGSYYIEHGLTDSDDDGAMVYVTGSGTAMIKLQGESSGGSSFNMGALPECGDGCAWDNNYATFDGTGTGNFELHAWAHNSLSVCANCNSKQWSVPGDGSDDSATYDLHVGYSGTWSYPDFGIKGN